MPEIYQTRSVLPKNDAALSLLSLSIAAAQVKPIQVARPVDHNATIVGSLNASLGAGHQSVPGGANLSSSMGNGVKQHRRLSSTGKARRRLSDARDAATRPS
jgi:hypothetical protein